MAHEAFLRAILDNPEDDAARLVYADWLEERGDPLGEFIHLQYALEGMTVEDDRRWALEIRARQLLYLHGKRWAGPLRRLVRRYSFRRGFVEAVTLSADDFLRRGEELFQLAPIRAVRLLEAQERIGELAACPLLDRLTGLDLRHTDGLEPARMHFLLRSPRIAGLRSLCLRGTGMCSGPGVRAVASCPHLTNLTALDLSDHRRDASIGMKRYWREQGLGGWWESNPHTHLDGPSMRALVESSHLTVLRALCLGGYGGCLHRDALHGLLGSALFSRLTDLDLSMDGTGFYAENPGLLPLIARTPGAASLHTLHLRKVGFCDGDMELPVSPCYLSGLTTLGLEDALYHAEPLRGLNDPGFPALKVLRLRGTVIYNLANQSHTEMNEFLTAVHGLPQLKGLDLHMSPVGSDGVQALVEGSLLPRLRWLSLANRGGFETAPIGTPAVQALAAAPGAARLVHLDLSNNDLDDAAAQALAASPHLGQLLSLDLWHNRLSGTGAAALAQSRSLRQLAFLNLRSNPLPSSVQPLLRQRFGPGVRYGKGRRLTDPPEPPLQPHSPHVNAPELDDDIPF